MVDGDCLGEPDIHNKLTVFWDNQNQSLTRNASDTQNVCRRDAEAVEDVARAVGVDDVDPTGIVLAGAYPDQG